MTGNGIDGFGTVLLALASSEQPTKIVVAKFIGSVVENCRHIDWRGALHSRGFAAGALVLLLGICCMQWPAVVLTLLSAGLGLAGIVWCGSGLMTYLLRTDVTDTQKKLRGAVYLLLFAFSVSLITSERLLLFSTHGVLGVVLLVVAARRVQAMAKQPGTSLTAKLWGGTVAALADMLGVVALTTTGTLPQTYIFVLGVCFTLYGLAQTVAAIYHSTQKEAV